MKILYSAKNEKREKQKAHFVALIIIILIGIKYVNIYREKDRKNDALTFQKNIHVEPLVQDDAFPVIVFSKEVHNQILFDVVINMDLSAKEIMMEYEETIKQVEMDFENTNFKLNNIVLEKITLFDKNGHGVVLKEGNEIYFLE